MRIFSFTTVLTALFIAYLINAIWSVYNIWHPDSCLAKGRKNYCLKSYIHQSKHIKWNIEAYSSPKQRFSSSSSSLLWKWDTVNFTEYNTNSLNITLPSVTRNNGSLFTHFFLYPSTETPFHSSSGVHVQTAITDRRVPVSYFKLINDKNVSGVTAENKLPVTHWRPKIFIYVMEENFLFDRMKLPGELQHLVRLTSKQEYLPILYIDELSYKKSDLLPIPKNATKMTLEIQYSPISVGKLRLWITLSHSMAAMKSLGFSDDDLDEVKGIFTDTNLIFLALTLVVSVFHLLFDFLAFKNDVTYWKKRSSMIGLSIHTVVYRCVSTIIIFFYLFDQKTSLLVLVPAGIGSLIEIWKVTKAVKFKVERSGWRLKFVFGESTDKEKATEDFDHQAMKYLSYVMYPLCIGAAIYSLFYVPHKSWYSWLIQSLVNAVYAFGFLFMLPQLFINYKLKSVAHLPWKAFMYKAFNTFIDDIFAFIIKMPTSHRLACFRDDIVFFCYLYQLWLYPVDKKRANEYGISYEEDHEKKD